MTNPLPIAKVPEKRPIPPWLIATGVSLLVAIAIVTPFFWFGSASGHDFEFHAASWLDAAYQWHEGTFYPRWTAWTNHGFGEPRFIFYPPFSWMLGAALTSLLPLTWVPIAFIVVTQTFAGLSAFVFLRRLASQNAAILGAAFYAANPYALLVTYIRSDFAEQLACAFLPLLLVATLNLADLLGTTASLRSRVLLFALPFAAIWLSNAPAGVISTYTVALIFTWATVTGGTGKFLFRGFAGIALGFGLTAFYLVPAAYEQRWVNIAQALATGLFPSENFLFTVTKDPEHTWFNWIASICAILLIVLAAAAALRSRRFSNEGARDKNREAWKALLLVGGAATILTLRFTALLWDLLPELRFVQFPWRWMSILALVAAAFIASAAERNRGWLWAPALLVLSLPLAYFLVSNTWWDSDEMPTQQSYISTAAGFDGTDEYDPLGDDHTDIPQTPSPQAVILAAHPGDTKPPFGRLDIGYWLTERKQLHVRVVSDARVALRVLNYPAWRVMLNGKPITPGRAEAINQMVIAVPAGDSEIHVRFMETPDRALGLILFSLSLLVVAAILLLNAYF